MPSVVIPGARDVRGTLDPVQGSEQLIVCCPPHPQHGGSRSDLRLVAVSEALTAAGIAAVRIEYGPWDGGHGECEDARNAIRWATENTEQVGIFGYSFGASIAILAASTVDAQIPVVSAAPSAQLADDLLVAGAVSSLDHVHVVVGERDEIVDWEPVAAAARDAGHSVTAMDTDHFIHGHVPQLAEITTTVFSSD